MKSLLCFLVLSVTFYAAESHLPPGTKALPSATEKGRGPLALVNLNHRGLRHARVFGAQQPDLFVAGYGGTQAVKSFKWVDAAENGAPVFAEPVVVKCACKDKDCVFQRPDGRVIGPWIDKEELVTTEFDGKKIEFRESKREKLPKAVKLPLSLGVLVGGNDHFHLCWRIDDYDVEDGGKLQLDEGKLIGKSGAVCDLSGRCKLDFFDWNQDGALDFVIGTGRVDAIPDRVTGCLMAALGQNPVVGGSIGSLVDMTLPTKAKKTLGTPLLMLNTGTNEQMQFARPLVFRDEDRPLMSLRLAEAKAHSSC